MKRLLFLLLLMSISTAMAESVQVATIQVMSRPAAAMIDAVRPLLGQSGGVTAFHDKLIVRGTAGEIADVRALLRQIDRPARRLLIEVREGGSLTLSTRGIGYGVDTGNVRLGHTPPGSDGQIRFQGAETRGQADSVQRVQALDGRPALIRVGQSVPVYQGYQDVVGRRVVQGFQVQYRDATSGFYALPRVHGGQVTVEIYQQRQRAAPDGAIGSQQASSVLRGKLGQWLTVGAIGGSDSDRRDELGLHVQTRRSSDRLIELRVLPVD